MLRRKTLILLIVGMFLSCHLYSQEYDWWVNGQAIKGFVLQHNKKVGHLISAHPEGFEINLQQELNGRRYWESLYNRPIVNYGLSYYNLYNDQQLGRLFIASAAMDLPLARKEKTALFIRIGTGLVYCTNPYDREFNNQNTMLSSTISYLLQTRLTYEIQLNENFKLTPNLNITHASNGAFTSPNRGINIVTANLGLSYRIIKKEYPETDLTLEAPREKLYKFYFLFSYGKGTKSLQVRKPRMFFNLAMMGHKTLNPKSDLQFGIEYFHNLGLREEIRGNWFLNDEERLVDFRRVGLLIGHELKAGKLGFISQLGVYVYNPSKSRMPVYQRYGLKYQLQKHLIVQTSLKVHAATAEQAELGLGWKF
ncbi:acyloxyacyl hydrolase [Marivirga sp. S37H4]|uniref:Acyloxyacyl hydrolase n=1 Tax=Marivirga aurantiaca TaxID=2802615 RepID=A0A935C5G1_9BACT|nr:acyloxyacyl hydrolase [Marivirga aurantiaca]MBK6263785.1 acyloxyacyl hydrolase [Marivirga aurantiaca]